jgi:N-acetylated-alpha-linked acidic dipeptidase
VTLTRVWGIAALRLANADILPFDFAANGAALQTFLTELRVGAGVDPERLPLTRLKERIAAFEKAGSDLRAVTLAQLRSRDIPAARLAELNARLMQVESNWLDPRGIPGRPWFQHLLYAARYTYAHLEFPGLTEAVEAQDWRQAAAQEDRLIAAFDRNTELLDAAAREWRGK